MHEGVAHRITQARKSAGLEASAMEAALQLSMPGYRDVEWHDDEITESLPFSKAGQLARLVKVPLLTLLEGTSTHVEEAPMSFEALRELVQTELDLQRVTKAGLSWEIDPFLKAPESAFELPIAFIQDLSKDLGFDWRRIIAYYDSEATREPDALSMTIRPYRVEDEAAVIQLWKDCGLIHPSNNAKRDIERKMKVNPELFLVGVVSENIAATAMTGYEGHRGWINYLAVAPQHRRQGVGRQIMAEAEAKLRALGCPKINLQIRTSNREVIAFYESLGFVQDDVVSFGKRLVVDEANS